MVIESWWIVGEVTDKYRGIVLRSWVEDQGFRSYDEADQVRLRLMQQHPNIDFFVKQTQQGLIKL